MINQKNLAGLLDAHMKKALVGDARLANMVNTINGNPYFIHRSTIRNWRTGSAQKVNNWRQLATVAIALRLDETETSSLLESGGCLSIQALNATTSETDQAILAHWQDKPAQATEATFLTSDTDSASDLQPIADGSKNQKKKPGLPGKKVSGIVHAGIVSVLGATAVLLTLSFSHFQFQPTEEPIAPVNLLVSSHFEQGATGRVAYTNPLLPSG